jgi:chorismate mutase/prephenate dehydratase
MSLNELRKKINNIDSKLVDILNQRAKLSLAVGEYKLKNKKGIYVPHREKEVFKRVKELNEGPMSKESFEAIYREIMSSSLSLEKNLQISYLGVIGSHTSVAAQKKFGASVEYVSCNNIWDIFQSVEHGECDYGVVPIENSVEGAVTHTFDLLVDSDLKICSQIMLKISHNLLSKGGIKSIKKIYSNPQVFGQCRNWLLQNLPKVKLIPTDSTTSGAQRASKEKGAAALASNLAGKAYGLKTIKENIQDIAHNSTRFLIISKEDASSTGKDRTSILFSIKDKVGALYGMLTPFYKNKINLTKIESRPCKKRAWDYYFFIDFEGHRKDENVKCALKQLEEMCKHLKVLGSYPVLD